MPLQFRPARPSDYPRLEKMVIDSFEPITWLKKVDDRFGPLNGKNWRERWRARFCHAFASQKTLVGEAGGRIVAYGSGNYDAEAKLGFIDLLCVDQRHQRKGYGREMLRGMMQFFREMGAEHVHLECLADNDAGNSLYRSEGFQEMARSVRWFAKIP